VDVGGTGVLVGVLVEHQSRPDAAMPVRERRVRAAPPEVAGGTTYGLPYLWDSYVTGYNSSQIKTAPPTWTALFSPASAAQHSGKITVPNDAVTLALATAGMFEFNFGDTEVFWTLLDLMVLVIAWMEGGAAAMDGAPASAGQFPPAEAAASLSNAGAPAVVPVNCP